MDSELERKLEEEFPFMKKKKGDAHSQKEIDGGVYDVYAAFGCQCNDGWYDLLHDLCQEIANVYEEAGTDPDIYPAQIKEKFGTLRFYYDVVGKEKMIHGIDFLGQGTVRFGDNDEDDTHKKVAEIVRLYEEKSASVCEKCGAEGSLRNCGYAATLCDNCFEDVMRIKEQKRLNMEKLKERKWAGETITVDDIIEAGMFKRKG